MHKKILYPATFMLFIMVVSYLMLTKPVKTPSYKIPASNKETSTAAKENTPKVSEELAEYLYLTADDQTAAQTATIKEMNYNGNVYVVIYEDDNGVPGKVLGQSEILIEPSTMVSIDLNRASEPDEILHAMLHFDDGNGVFEFPNSDGPLLDDNNDQITTSFKITN